ncbi:MAG: Gfo/Idh/MocA family oxidoreductase [Lachnospiraceae bacterium]|nr:Gfo/Idh/MocA family oxidoreductase [Lachnospiraceae bacterium]
MELAVIGLGSMGRRRIRLLRRLRPADRLIGIDGNPERCKQAEEELSVETEASLSEALLKHRFHYAFVCTSPIAHAEIIRQCLNGGISVFSELNLVVDGYEENIRLAKEKGRLLYLSSTMQFRREIRYITDRVKKYEKPLCYRYHVGQYLKDWHPWESYKSFFVDDVRTNGCREIMALEFPWMEACFGKILSIEAKACRLSDLEIQYPDHYTLFIEHETGRRGTFTVDIVCRKPVVDLEIYGEQLYLSWNGSAEGLFEFDIENRREEKVTLYESTEHLEGYSETILENEYESELVNFFDVAEQGAAPLYSFEKDREILRWIDRVEENVQL